MQKAKKILEKLGLSTSETELYLTMLAHGALEARELLRLTRAKRPTVYYALKQLENRGLIHAVPAASGKQRFQAEPPEHLLTMLQLREQEVHALLDEATAALPELRQTSPAREGIPAVSFYQGEQAMKQIVMETLYAKSRHMDCIAPHDNFFWQIGQTFSQRYIDERATRGITTRNLWEEPLKPEILTRSYQGRSQVRILPASMHNRFRTTIFLYDDKVMYISSVASGYVLLVQSKEHHETMKAMFDGLWESSQPVSTS